MDEDARQRAMVRMIKSFWKNYLRLTAFLSPVLLALVLLLAVPLLWKGEVPPWFLSLFFFVAGFSGVIVAVKREVPTGLYSIRGWRAAVEGIIFTIICWGLALVLLLHPL